jgi:hypothetical protein
MTRQRALRSASLLLPALLGWIVLLGEVNRLLDRSAGVAVPASARAILGTSYSGPRLVLSGQIFLPRQVESKQFPAGSEVLLRYRRSNDDWVFEAARSTRDRQWSPSEIDIPARVERSRYASNLMAVPLAPADFAVSRATVSRIRSNARVALVVRRGALGNVRVESAAQTGDSLGTVVGLVEGSRNGPVAFGSTEQSLDPRSFVTAQAAGWIARIENGKIRGGAALPGRPLDSARLADGRLEIATASGPIFSEHGFDLLQVGSDLAATGSARHFHGFLISLASDGSVWSLSKPPSAVSREGTQLIHSNPSGTSLAEVRLRASVAVVGVRDDFVADRSSDAVIRYRVQRDQVVETDRWTVEGLVGAFFLDPQTLIAGGSKGAFALSAGERDARPLFVPDPSHRVVAVHADDAGDLVISTAPPDFRPDSSTIYEPGMAVGPPEHLWFLPKAGAEMDLGEIGAEPESDFQPESPNRFTAGRRVIVRGGDLYFASRNQILIFDLASKRLKSRIVEQAYGQSRRIF